MGGTVNLWVRVDVTDSARRQWRNAAIIESAAIVISAEWGGIEINNAVIEAGTYGSSIFHGSGIGGYGAIEIRARENAASGRTRGVAGHSAVVKLTRVSATA